MARGTDAQAVPRAEDWAAGGETGHSRALRRVAHRGTAESMHLCVCVCAAPRLDASTNEGRRTVCEVVPPGGPGWLPLAAPGLPLRVVEPDGRSARRRRDQRPPHLIACPVRGPMVRSGPSGPLQPPPAQAGRAGCAGTRGPLSAGWGMGAPALPRVPSSPFPLSRRAADVRVPHRGPPPRRDVCVPACEAWVRASGCSLCSVSVGLALPPPYDGVGAGQACGPWCPTSPRVRPPRGADACGRVRKVLAGGPDPSPEGNRDRRTGARP